MFLPRCALVLFVCAVVVFTCPLSPVAAQSEDPAKGAALLAEARKAIGGEEKLAAVKRLQVKGDMRRGQGNVTLEGDSEIFLEPPDKFRRNESLGIGLGGPGIERVEILNGNEVIDENTGGGRGGFARGGDFGGGRGGGDVGGDFGGFRGRRDGGGGNAAGTGDAQRGRGQIDPERLKEAQRRARQTEVARVLVAMLLSTSAPVAWIGTAQSPDGTADVLEIKIEGNPTRLFLDSSTHMPLMLTWSGGRNRTQEMHLSDYKVVGGLKLPHLITRGVSGETSEEWTVKSYKLNPNFKANTFTK
jgi:outer membrane lipoprotein-sorting protein